MKDIILSAYIETHGHYKSFAWFGRQKEWHNGLDTFTAGWNACQEYMLEQKNESNPDRTFSGEFESETELSELTQFNSEGEKIAHFVYHIP